MGLDYVGLGGLDVTTLTHRELYLGIVLWIPSLLRKFENRNADLLSQTDKWLNYNHENPATRKLCGPAG